MSKYLLKVLIDPETVKFFSDNNQKIVIVKKVNNGDPSTANVAWVTFTPFEVNTVIWEDIYGLYSSYTELQGNASIVKSSYVLASTKNTYPFESGIFSSPVLDSSISDNTYEVLNKMSEYEYLTFGLAQNVQVNGLSYEGNPINATSVLPNQVASFTPNERIYIFMQSNIDNAVLISGVTSTELDIDFTGKSEVTIKYDNSIGGFVKM